MLEILTREDGGEPKWVDIKTLRTMNRRTKKSSTQTSFRYKDTQERIKLINSFNDWYFRYSKRTTKKQSREYWFKHITLEMVEKIMEHTKLYVEGTDKKFRLDPIRYLKREKWNDEIIKQDKRIDIEEYKHDTTGMPMGKCEECGKRDTYLNQWELYKGSSCCGEKVLPFN